MQMQESDHGYHLGTFCAYTWHNEYTLKVHREYTDTEKLKIVAKQNTEHNGQVLYICRSCAHCVLQEMQL